MNDPNPVVLGTAGFSFTRSLTCGTLGHMNISELARRLRVSTDELRSKLPELGFDIGAKALKIPDHDVGKIMNAWQEFKKRQFMQKRMEDQKARTERKALVATGEAEKVAIPSVITVRDFATALNLPVQKVMQELMRNGILAALNERIDFDSASIIAEDLGFIAEREEAKNEVTVGAGSEKLAQTKEAERVATDAIGRPPVVVVMGHVDHGKTSLLDVIRKANVVAGEAGGITQHIGAYQVEHAGKQLTFIDTPGHEAFTVMRSRGAKVADIAILVVAADDGVQPQTKEAIDIIKAAKMPFVVAINKIDKENANIEHVKSSLSELGLVPEDWGGKTICVQISAKKQINIDGLLDVLLLVNEMEKDNIVANPKRLAMGTIIESRIDKGQGPIATIIVQTGTLKVGDDLAVGGYLYGRVRALTAFDGKSIKSAPPSTPVKILGFKVPPAVGDILEVPEDASQLEDAKALASKQSAGADIGTKQIKAEVLQEGETGKPVLNIMIKADVLGSLEALVGMIEKIDNPHVAVRIVQKGLGNVSEADVLRAEAAQAVVYAFSVRAFPSAQDLARSKSVVVLEQTVIYRIYEDVIERLKKLVPSDKIYTEIGTGEVLALFKKLDKGQVLGAKVKKGKFVPGAMMRVLRAGQVIGEGKVEALQSGKTTVKDVLAGQDCGLSFIGKARIEVGDMIELYKEELHARTFSS
jgi:translation initiation factor IF-2